LALAAVGTFALLFRRGRDEVPEITYLGKSRTLVPIAALLTAAGATLLQFQWTWGVAADNLIIFMWVASSLGLCFVGFRVAEEAGGARGGVLALLTHLVVLGLGVTHVGLAVHTMQAGGILENTPEGIEGLWGLVVWARWCTLGLTALLALVLVLKYRDPVWVAPEYPGEPSILRLVRVGMTTLVALVLLIAAFFGVFLASGDYFLFYGFFSHLLAVGLIGPLALWGMHWTARERFAGGKAARRFLAVGLFAGILAFLPLMTTPLYTHPRVDAQFTEVFGQDWRARLPAGLGRAARFSARDAYFGMEIPANARFDVPYATGFPTYASDNTSVIEHTFRFDAYLPPSHQFGTPGDPLPVIILLHGEWEDKGPWNANITSQYLANQGYLVCDLNYGYFRAGAQNHSAIGYTLRDQYTQIGRFTQYLALHAVEYHADLGRTFLGGRHLGGGLALGITYGHETPGMAGLFSPAMQVRGVITFYPVSDIGRPGDGWPLSVGDQPYPFMLGDDDPDWEALNPIDIVRVSPPAVPCFFVTGGHDFVIPMSYNWAFIDAFRGVGGDLILAEYLFGSDGFDGAHGSAWGQSVLFYWERFMALALSA
jgi:acetyl esterase/lipase